MMLFILALCTLVFGSNPSTLSVDESMVLVSKFFPHVTNHTILREAAIDLIHMRRAEAARPAPVYDPKPLIDCPPLQRRPNPPENINDLHVMDVRVVGAIGDSMTVGTNALSASWLSLESFPGLSWSMGGDKDRITMPNLLKTFSDDLDGMSYGEGLSQMNLNMAVDGAMAKDMPGQAIKLIEAVKNDPDVDYEQDWKVVTVLVGGNDLCQVCHSPEAHSPELYDKYLREAFAILDTMPRTYVSVMSALQYTQIYQFVGPFCRIALDIFCPCVPDSNQDTRDYVDKINHQYNDIIRKIYEDYRNNHGVDFGVVYQPFQEDTQLPDASYLSTADCFHPSGEGHRLFAKGLWNNMITRVPDKKTFVDPTTQYLCPDNSTLLWLD